MVRYLGGRHRRRQHRRGRCERCAARRPAERRRRARPGVLRPRWHASYGHRCQPGAWPARRRPFPRRRDEARRGGGRSARITEHVAKPLGLSLADAADGILRIAVSSMSLRSERRLHRARPRRRGVLADRLRRRRPAARHADRARDRHVAHHRAARPRPLLAPSACCTRDLRYDFVRTWFTRLEDAPFAEIERIYQRLIAQGSEGARR